MLLRFWPCVHKYAKHLESSVDTVVSCARSCCTIIKLLKTSRAETPRCTFARVPEYAKQHVPVHLPLSNREVLKAVAGVALRCSFSPWPTRRIDRRLAFQRLEHIATVHGLRNLLFFRVQDPTLIFQHPSIRLPYERKLRRSFAKSC